MQMLLHVGNNRAIVEEEILRKFSFSGVFVEKKVYRDSNVQIKLWIAMWVGA